MGGWTEEQNTRWEEEGGARKEKGEYGGEEGAQGGDGVQTQPGGSIQKGRKGYCLRDWACTEVSCPEGH